MKKTVMALLIVGVLVLVVGCVEPFLSGVVAGATAMEQLAIQQQQEFNAAMESLNAEKENIDALIGQIEDSDVKAYLHSLVDDKTLEYIQQLQSADWKDPKVSIGYGLALLSAITAAYQKYQRTQEKDK